MNVKDFLQDGKVNIWPEKYAVCKLNAPISNCFTLIQDRNEITAVVEEKEIPEELILEIAYGWKIITFDMVLPFELVGFLAVIASELAKSGISIFALSAFSTDHILVKEVNLQKAIMQLKSLGCDIQYI